MAEDLPLCEDLMREVTDVEGNRRGEDGGHRGRKQDLKEERELGSRTHIALRVAKLSRQSQPYG